MNSVFIDSNVIIRYFAGDTSAKRLLEPVLQGDVKGYINSVGILRSSVYNSQTAYRQEGLRA
jgi:predicted nucleic acid-binding protein